MAAAWSDLRAARAALADAREHAEEAVRRRGELEYLVERVDAAEVAPGEREQITVERERLRHLDELAAAITGAIELLSPDDGEGAQTVIARASQLVADAERFEPSLAAVSAELRDAGVRLQEATAELRSHTADLEADPGRLEAIEQRLELFAELERRFGGSLDQVLALASEARETLDLLDQSGDAMAQLEAAEGAAQERAEAAAVKLHAARLKAAKGFARAVEQELSDLGMDGARLVVELTELHWAPAGWIAVSFCWPPTPASSRRRWQAPRRAASCPGSRWRSGWRTRSRRAPRRSSWMRSTPVSAGLLPGRWVRSSRSWPSTRR